jgi:putative flippase GtrA
MRFVRFNGVGAIGFAVQIGVLACLLRADMPYLPATAVAVEISILNNFLWHERWTWRDRPASGRARLIRFARFHALNGLVSLGGNLLVVSTLTGTLGVNPIVSNVVAVIVCGVLNFFGADRIVFVPGAVSSSPQHVIETEPPGTGKEQPQENHEVQHFRQVQEVTEPIQNGRGFDGGDLRRHERAEHHADQQDTRDGSQETEAEHGAARELDRGHHGRGQLRSRHACLADRLAHFLPARRNEQLAASRQEEQEPNGHAREQLPEPLPRGQRSDDRVEQHQVLTIRSAERSASATNVSVAFVQPPVGSVGDPATNRFS